MMTPQTVSLDFQEGPLPDPKTEHRYVIVWKKATYTIIEHLVPDKARGQWFVIESERRYTRFMEPIVDGEAYPSQYLYLWAFWPATERT